MTLSHPPTIDPVTGHRFHDSTLVRQALTHSSCDRPGGDNQRLEFLGDAVLDLVVAEALYAKFPGADEGALDRARASIVNGKNIAGAANQRKLGKYLEVGEAHRQHHPEPSRAMLEDALEALIGAVYLDGGLAAARLAIGHIFGEQIDSLEPSTGSQNPKGRLQEWSQKHHAGAVPVYEELPAEGPDHRRTYRAAVRLEGRELGRGTGPSKKSAEAHAAEAALQSLSKAKPQS
ncbi:MAG: ribonuclease III [Verrucomicrobia bacterium]|jgi:ribonuclease-3|nr:ribonuclease III [Verrucomicrobiota bacterium]